MVLWSVRWTFSSLSGYFIYSFMKNKAISSVVDSQIPQQNVSLCLSFNFYSSRPGFIRICKLCRSIILILFKDLIFSFREKNDRERKLSLGQFARRADFLFCFPFISSGMDRETCKFRQFCKNQLFSTENVNTFQCWKLPPKQCVISWKWQAFFAHKQLGVETYSSKRPGFPIWKNKTKNFHISKILPNGAPLGAY